MSIAFTLFFVLKTAISIFTQQKTRPPSGRVFCKREVFTIGIFENHEISLINIWHTKSADWSILSAQLLR